MASIYVDSAGGAPVSPFASWADAAATLAAALAVATSADVIYVDDGHLENGVLGITLTFPTTIGLKVLSVDKALGASPGAVSAGAQVTIGAGNVGFAINNCAYVYGMSFLGATNNSGSATVNIASSTTPHSLIFENCTIRARTPAAVTGINFGPSASTSNDEVFISLIDCSIGVGVSSGSINCRGVVLRGQNVSISGTAPTSLFSGGGRGADVEIVGSDLTGLAWTNLVSGGASHSGRFVFSQCKLVASYVRLSTASTYRGNAEVYTFDCANGDSHGLFGYSNAQGSVDSDTGVYFTSGAAEQSWKIVTKASCNFYNPFVTPWIGYYNTGTSAITPYVEIMRDGSATAYQDDEVWVDIAAKVTATSTMSTLYSNRMTLLGTAANQDAGAGLGSWTGESGTAWSGKLALGSSITPAENGHIQARIVVGEPSITVYADPQIRT